MSIQLSWMIVPSNTFNDVVHVTSPTQMNWIIGYVSLLFFPFYFLITHVWLLQSSIGITVHKARYLYEGLIYPKKDIGDSILWTFWKLNSLLSLGRSLSFYTPHRHTQNPVKHVKRNILQKKLTAKILSLFLQNTPS